MNLAKNSTTAAGQRKWFRILALLLPLVILGVLEIGLRWVGAGYPTSFFLRVMDQGRLVLVDNPKFGWRFFPPAVSRTAQPQCLPIHKPAGSCRIFLFGESAAMGDPEPAYGLARQIERILRTRHPEWKIDVINVGMTAINSHVIREIAHDCAPLDADCWLLYAGNNEVVGPFGAGTVFGRQAASIPMVRANLMVKSTRLGQLLGRWFKNSREPAEWQGMELFLHQQVPRSDPRLASIYKNFGLNLAAIIRCGQKSGARVLVSTVPVNLKDCPPFASAHRAGLSPSETKEWEAIFARGREAEKAGRFADALAAYQGAARIDAEFAELAFRRASCELAQSQPEAAQTDLLLARDLDTLRFRADSSLNNLTRRVTAEAGAGLIDAEQEFARRSPVGGVGEEVFCDHVHLNFDGNYRLAMLFVPEIERELFGRQQSQPAVDETEVARQLAFTDFDRRRIGEEMRLRLQQPPFSSQLNFEARDRWWRDSLMTMGSSPKTCVGAYRTAVALAPQDWVLRANFGALLEAANEPDAATVEWREVSRLLPHKAESWFHLGNLAYSAGSYVEAKKMFHEALRRDPATPEALSGLGLCESELGQTNAAIREFELALRVNPHYSAARVNLALVLSKTGDSAGAMALYRQTLEIDSNNVAARINLGKLFARQKQYDEAIRLYTAALQIDPGEPVAEHNLGNALVALGRSAEAIPHYFAAVQKQPDFVEARYNLAVEQGRAGQLNEAVDQFATVVRLKPEFVEARFNFGITLAKARRYGEAVQQFQEALRLRPDYAPASAALQRALSLEHRGAAGAARGASE